jgi:hypothetical protein
MRSTGLTITPAILGIIGLGLLGFETVESMRSVAISTLGTTLIFAGLGLFVIAAVLVVVGMMVDEDVTQELPPPPPAEVPTES